MESLNFPDNKLPPSAIIKRFTTNSFLLHRLPHRLLLLPQPSSFPFSLLAPKLP